MKKGVFILQLMAATFLYGCTMTTNECDPANRSAGFMDKFGCTVSGSYSKRVEDKQNRVNELKAEHARLLSLKSTIDNETALVDGSKKDRQAQLDKVSAEITQVKKDIISKNAMSDSLRQKIDSLEKQLEEMKNGDDDILIKRQADYDKLKKEYDDLLAAASGAF